MREAHIREMGRSADHLSMSDAAGGIYFSCIVIEMNSLRSAGDKVRKHGFMR